MEGTPEPVVGAVFFISDFNRFYTIGLNRPYTVILLAEYLRWFVVDKSVLREVTRQGVNNRDVSIFVPVLPTYFLAPFAVPPGGDVGNNQGNRGAEKKSFN